jgi:ribosomal protein L13
MRSMILAGIALSVLPMSGCVASKIVTVPISLAGDALEATGKGVVMVGATAVRVTGDALDGPDEMVRLTVTYKKGRGERSEERIVKAKHVEREIKKMSKEGKVIDIEVAPVG